MAMVNSFSPTYSSFGAAGSTGGARNVVNGGDDKAATISKLARDLRAAMN